MTIRLRLTLGMTALVIVAFAALAYQVLGEIRPRLLEAMEDTMVEMANVLASNPNTLRDIVPTMIELKRRKLGATIFNNTKDLSALRVLISDGKGIVQYDSDGKDSGKDFSQWHDIARTLRGEYGARSTRSVVGDSSTSAKFVSAPIRSGERVTGVVTVSMPSASIANYLVSARKKVIATFVLIAVVAAVLAVLLSMWLSTPINQLILYARAVTRGERATLPTTNIREMRELGEAFQSMREALEGKKYVESYTQTLTHELKSPLAGIRAAAEILVENPPEADAQKFLGNILSQTERVTELIDRMLLLSSLERKDTLAKQEDCDLKKIVTEVMESVSPKVIAKALSVETHLETARVKGDSFLLRHALSNLVDNAIDFSPQGSSLRVSLRTHDLAAVFDVEDRGPGIPPASLDRVFERFYSLPRPSGKRSSGIGLNLVKEVAVLHKGDIILENRKEGGARASLKLPL